MSIPNSTRPRGYSTKYSARRRNARGEVAILRIYRTRATVTATNFPPVTYSVITVGVWSMLPLSSTAATGLRSVVVFWTSFSVSTSSWPAQDDMACSSGRSVKAQQRERRKGERKDT